MSQLTSKNTCKRKTTYHTLNTARNARKRRNRTGKVCLTQYKCNVCNYWHLTAQEREKP